MQCAAGAWNCTQHMAPLPLPLPLRLLPLATGPAGLGSVARARQGCGTAAVPDTLPPPTSVPSPQSSSQQRRSYPFAEPHGKSCMSPPHVMAALAISAGAAAFTAGRLLAQLAQPREPDRFHVQSAAAAQARLEQELDAVAERAAVQLEQLQAERARRQAAESALLQAQHVAAAREQGLQHRL